jgi:hypothetical protein
MKKLLLLLLFIPLVSFGQDKEKKGLNDIIEQVKKLAKEIDIDGLISKADTIPAIPLQPLIKSIPKDLFFQALVRLYLMPFFDNDYNFPS